MPKRCEGKSGRSELSAQLEPEELDDLTLSGPALERTLADLGRLNRALGNTRAVTRAVLSALPPSAAPATVAELACGGGDLLAAVGAALAERGAPPARLLGLDGNPHTVAWASAQHPGVRFVVADATAPDLALPEGCDVLFISHFLYHLPDAEALVLLRRLLPQVRRAIILSELVRSRAALWGFGLLAAGLGVAPLTRRDGRRAIQRAWTPAELRALLSALGPAHRWQLRRPDPFRMVVTIPAAEVGR